MAKVSLKIKWIAQNIKNNVFYQQERGEDPMNWDKMSQTKQFINIIVMEIWRVQKGAQSKRKKDTRITFEEAKNQEYNTNKCHMHHAQRGAKSRIYMELHIF